MTDLEINKALALAIGYLPEHVVVVVGVVLVQRALRGNPLYSGLHNFDYKDWQTIGPIAERFDCFPIAYSGYWVSACKTVFSDTPQKAIALAMIGAKK